MHLPDGWSYTKIGNIADLTAGGTPSTKKQEYWGGDVLWMSSGEVHKKNIYEVSGRITQEGLANSSAKIIPVNSILIALAGQGKTRGTVAVNKVELTTNQSIASIIPDIASIFYLYLFYNLESRYYELRRLSTGDGGRGGLNLSLLKSVQLILPTYEEQQKIAQILSTWDKAIEKLEALIAAKQKRKKALMQQLLTGKKRFAGFEGEWKFVELCKLFKEVKDKVGTEKIIPHSITAGVGFVSHEEKWGKDISGTQYENYTLLKKGQFSYNKGNSKKYPCGCMYLLKHSSEIAVPNVFISFERNSENVCNEFYEQYFIADYCARELRRYITSGARSDGLLNLNKTNFFSIKAPLPQPDEQQKIASVLSAADQEIEIHQNQLSALKEQKKGLMQQLLTGKKRVKLDS